MEEVPILVSLDSVTVYIFLFDMILGFLTSYTNTQTGEEVWGYKFVARHYVFEGTFILDLLSTFQLDKMVEDWGVTNVSIINFLGLLGFLKI